VDFTPSTSAVQFGDEVRELIASVFTDDVRQRVHDTGTMHDWGLHRAMAAKGWIEQALPEALGGGGRDPEELAVLFRELELAGAPYDGLSICTMVASVIAHVGNDMQRRVVLPKLLAGESLIALGYSEPDSGSDVAAARTRAVRDGDGWRIDGQKIFTSLAEECEWVFLLTRTDPDVPKHQGLTFFLVPTAAPGFEVQPIRTLSGKRTNMTFYDGVYVDDEWRIGEVNGGWQVMLVALSFERGVAGGVRDAARLLTVAEEHARTAVDESTGRPLLEDHNRRRELVRLAIDCEVTDLLASRAVWVAASGQLPGVEGAATKLFATEALRRAVSRLLDANGPAGLVQSHDVTDLSAFYEYCYRFAPVTTIYGGTSEIQRNLVAQRGLGLPRSR
jgi:alkylation response protein AidB-like acyl-CoA dehydrogenase